MIDIGKYLQSAIEDGYYKGKSEAEENAAKEIAKLKAERDAAVADLKKYAECVACKHMTTDEWYTETCTKCGWYPWNSVSEEKNIWEWRGLSLVEKTSDKEGKHE